MAQDWLELSHYIPEFSIVRYLVNQTAAYIAMLISIIYRSLYFCMLTGIHRSMERVTSDFRRSCLASSSSVFIVAINTCNTLQWRRVRDTNSCERLITCSSGIRDK